MENTVELWKKTTCTIDTLRQVIESQLQQTVFNIGSKVTIIRMITRCSDEKTMVLQFLEEIKDAPWMDHPRLMEFWKESHLLLLQKYGDKDSLAICLQELSTTSIYHQYLKLYCTNGNLETIWNSVQQSFLGKPSQYEAFASLVDIKKIFQFAEWCRDDETYFRIAFHIFYPQQYFQVVSKKGSHLRDIDFEGIEETNVYWRDRISIHPDDYTLKKNSNWLTNDRSQGEVPKNKRFIIGVSESLSVNQIYAEDAPFSPIEKSILTSIRGYKTIWTKNVKHCIVIEFDGAGRVQRVQQIFGIEQAYLTFPQNATIAQRICTHLHQIFRQDFPSGLRAIDIYIRYATFTGSDVYTTDPLLKSLYAKNTFPIRPHQWTSMNQQSKENTPQRFQHNVHFTGQNFGFSRVLVDSIDIWKGNHRSLLHNWFMKQTALPPAFARPLIRIFWYADISEKGLTLLDDIVADKYTFPEDIYQKKTEEYGPFTYGQRIDRERRKRRDNRNIWRYRLRDLFSIYKLQLLQHPILVHAMTDLQKRIYFDRDILRTELTRLLSQYSEDDKVIPMILDEAHKICAYTEEIYTYFDKTYHIIKYYQKWLQWLRIIPSSYIQHPLFAYLCSHSVNYNGYYYGYTKYEPVEFYISTLFTWKQKKQLTVTCITQLNTLLQPLISRSLSRYVRERVLENLSETCWELTQDLDMQKYLTVDSVYMDRWIKDILCCSQQTTNAKNGQQAVWHLLQQHTHLGTPTVLHWILDQKIQPMAVIINHMQAMLTTDVTVDWSTCSQTIIQTLLSTIPSDLIPRLIENIVARDDVYAILQRQKVAFSIDQHINLIKHHASIVDISLQQYLLCNASLIQKLYQTNPTLLFSCVDNWMKDTTVLKLDLSLLTEPEILQWLDVSEQNAYPISMHVQLITQSLQKYTEQFQHWIYARLSLQQGTLQYTQQWFSQIPLNLLMIHPSQISQMLSALSARIRKKKYFYIVESLFELCKNQHPSITIDWFRDNLGSISVNNASILSRKLSFAQQEQICVEIVQLYLKNHSELEFILKRFVYKSHSDTTVQVIDYLIKILMLQSKRKRSLVDNLLYEGISTRTDLPLEKRITWVRLLIKDAHIRHRESIYIQILQGNALYQQLDARYWVDALLNLYTPTFWDVAWNWIIEIYPEKTQVNILEEVLISYFTSFGSEDSDFFVSTNSLDISFMYTDKLIPLWQNLLQNKPNNILQIIEILHKELRQDRKYIAVAMIQSTFNLWQEASMDTEKGEGAGNTYTFRDVGSIQLHIPKDRDIEFTIQIGKFVCKFVQQQHVWSLQNDNQQELVSAVETSDCILQISVSFGKQIFMNFSTGDNTFYTKKISKNTHIPYIMVTVPNEFYIWNEVKKHQSIEYFIKSRAQVSSLQDVSDVVTEQPIYEKYRGIVFDVKKYFQQYTAIHQTSSIKKITKKQKDIYKFSIREAFWLIFNTWVWYTDHPSRWKLLLYYWLDCTNTTNAWMAVLDQAFTEDATQWIQCIEVLSENIAMGEKLQLLDAHVQKQFVLCSSGFTQNHWMQIGHLLQLHHQNLSVELQRLILDNIPVSLLTAELCTTIDAVHHTNIQKRLDDLWISLSTPLQCQLLSCVGIVYAQCDDKLLHLTTQDVSLWWPSVSTLDWCLNSTMIQRFWSKHPFLQVEQFSQQSIKAQTCILELFSRIPSAQQTDFPSVSRYIDANPLVIRELPHDIIASILPKTLWPTEWISVVAKYWDWWIPFCQYSQNIALESACLQAFVTQHMISIPDVIQHYKYTVPQAYGCSSDDAIAVHTEKILYQMSDIAIQQKCSDIRVWSHFSTIPSDRIQQIAYQGHTVVYSHADLHELHCNQLMLLMSHPPADKTGHQTLRKTLDAFFGNRIIDLVQPNTVSTLLTTREQAMGGGNSKSIDDWVPYTDMIEILSTILQKKDASYWGLDQIEIMAFHTKKNIQKIAYSLYLCTSVQQRIQTDRGSVLSMLQHADGETIEFFIQHMSTIFGEQWSVLELLRLTESQSLSVRKFAINKLHIYWEQNPKLLVCELSEHPEPHMESYLLDILENCITENVDIINDELLHIVQVPFRRILGRVNSGRNSKLRVLAFFDWCLLHKNEYVGVFEPLLSWLSAGPDRELAVTRLLQLSHHHPIALPFSIQETTIRRNP